MGRAKPFTASGNLPSGFAEPSSAPQRKRLHIWVEFNGKHLSQPMKMLAISAFSCSGLGGIMSPSEVFNEQTGRESWQLRQVSCQGSGHPPKNKMPLCKAFACLILLKVCFFTTGRFVISGWFCPLLPEMHLISISFQRWCSPGEKSYCTSPACSRNICGLDWHTGWIPVPFNIWKSTCGWLQSEPSTTLGQRDSSECCGLSLSPLNCHFALFFAL